jgi:hypothetical protein
MHACGVRLSVLAVGQLLLGRSHQNEHERITALTIVTLMVDWLDAGKRIHMSLVIDGRLLVWYVYDGMCWLC